MEKVLNFDSGMVKMVEGEVTILGQGIATSVKIMAKPRDLGGGN